MNRKLLLTFAVLAIAVGGGAFFFGKNIPAPTQVDVVPAAGQEESAVTEENAQEQAEAAAVEETVHGAVADEVVIEETVTEEGATDEAAADAAPEAATQTAAIDVEKALAVRTVGSADAPVKLEEFASLSCSHCADFYKNTYPKLKTEYIDTGKVQFTYTDFPLNAPALEAALVARCLPEGHYFNFLKALFENQKDWAFTEQFSEKLKHNAAMLGMSTDSYNACVSSEELRKGLMDRMQKAAETHQIQSTPSFIFNDKEPMKGAVDYEAFKKKIDELLAAKN